MEPYYLSLAERIAKTIKKYGVDPSTGLIASEIDIKNKKPVSIDKLGWAGWGLCGLWLLYWETGNESILNLIKMHSDAFWEKCIPPIGLPYREFDLESNRGKGSEVSFRIQYQTHTLGNWIAYLNSLDAALNYQVKADTKGCRTIVNTLDGDKPEETHGLFSPDYFGCLDLRIPYAHWTNFGDRFSLEVILDDYKTHERSTPTGLWHGKVRFGQKNLLIGENRWYGGTADDTYCGLILQDLIRARNPAKAKELFQIVKRQTDLALEYGMDKSKSYFVNKVDVRNGKLLDPSCRWHTNWEWCLTLLILWEYTQEQKYFEYADRNYEFLIKNLDNPGNWAHGQGDDWNLPQLGLLCLFRYHQTGDAYYLRDAFKVGEFIKEHRLRIEGDEVWVGKNDLMSVTPSSPQVARLPPRGGENALGVLN